MAHVILMTFDILTCYLNTKTLYILYIEVLTQFQSIHFSSNLTIDSPSKVDQWFPAIDLAESSRATAASGGSVGRR